MAGFAVSHDDFRQPCAHADIGATHSLLVSEFASFNTLGVVDGQVLGYAYWATRNTIRCNK